LQIRDRKYLSLLEALDGEADDRPFLNLQRPHPAGIQSSRFYTKQAGGRRRGQRPQSCGATVLVVPTQGTRLPTPSPRPGTVPRDFSIAPKNEQSRIFASPPCCVVCKWPGAAGAALPHHCGFSRGDGTPAPRSLLASSAPRRAPSFFFQSPP